MREIFVISSENKISGTNSNFVVPLEDHLKNGDIQLLGCNIPKVYANVTEFNNKISTDAITLSIQIGAYTLTGLMQEIGSAMDSVVPGHGFTYSDITNQFTLENATSFVLNNPSDSVFSNIFGYDSVYPSGILHLSNQTPQFFNKNIYIGVQEFSNKITSTSANDITFEISTTGFGKSDFINYNINSNFNQFARSEQRPTSLRIKLTDENGHELVNLSNWSMSFALNPDE